MEATLKTNPPNILQRLRRIDDDYSVFLKMLEIAADIQDPDFAVPTIAALNETLALLKKRYRLLSRASINLE